MSAAIPFEPPTDDPSSRFPSLASLQEAHTRLLERRREAGVTADFLEEIESFLPKGRATGALLDSETERTVAQSLLDYWVALLYRLNQRTAEATLDDFDPSLAPTLDDANCPYVGLDAFREKDRYRFFGRQDLIDKMVERLTEQRFLAVVGPSGSGKSSLVLGGLLPRLKNGAAPGSETWRYLPPFVPGSEPLANLARAVLPPDSTAASIQDLAQRLSQSPESLIELAAGDLPWVIVIDQFEEIITLCEDEPARQAFARSLQSLVETPSPRHTVILTLRSDYETYMTRLPALQPLYGSGQERVPPLKAGELREAIERPAEIVGLKLEEGIVDELIHDLLGDPAGLPLLQFTLLKLWEGRDHNRITWKVYEALGSGRSALANSAQRFYDNDLSSAEQVTAKRILLRMVQPSGNLEFTSSRIRREALLQIEDPSRVERVLEKLGKAHLVRLTRSETAADVQVEIAHEALVRNWPTLVEWLEEQRSQIRIRRRWEAQAEEWVRLGRGASGLLDEVQVFEAERWLESADAAMLGSSKAFPQLVQASRKAMEEKKAEEEAARRRELEQAHKLAEAERHRAEEKQRRLDDATKAKEHSRLFAISLGILLAATLILLHVALRFYQSNSAQEITSMALESDRRILAQYYVQQERKKRKQEKDSEIKNVQDALTVLGHRSDELKLALGQKEELQAGLEATRKDLGALSAAKQATDLAFAEERRRRITAEGNTARLERELAEERPLRVRAEGKAAELEETLKRERTLREGAEQQAITLGRTLEEERKRYRNAGFTALEQQVKNRQRQPLRIGTSIGTELGPKGILCCFVRDKDRKTYLLGLAAVFGREVGTPVLQFGPGNERGEPVAVLRRAGQSSAIAEILPGFKIDLNIPALGKMKDLETTVDLGEKFTLVRSGGKVVSGRAIEVKKKGLTYVDIILDIPFNPEDLGAPVFAEDRDLLGMIDGPADGRSHVTYIKQALAELNLSVVDEVGRVLR